jgi:hypothetical protein
MMIILLIPLRKDHVVRGAGRFNATHAVPSRAGACARR